MKSALYEEMNNTPLGIRLKMGTLMRVRDCFRTLDWEILEKDRVVSCQLLASGIVHLHERDGTVVVIQANDFVRRYDGNN